jgi:predicted lipid-binding transport protein (Tim44 family)
MSQPLAKTNESEKAESQRKTFKGIGCAAGFLAFPAPFIFGFQAGLGMIPILIIIGLVFMFLANEAKDRRDRSLVASPGQVQQYGAPVAAPAPQPYFQPAAVTAPNHKNQAQDSDSKLNERLAKAKKAGL